jgi:ribosomal protein S18 acetylase RimI-like enzyme
MINQTTVEKALSSDLEEILTLQKLTFQNEAELFNDYTITPLIQTLESIKDDFKNNIYLKATYNSIIIGSVRAYIKDNICHIGRLIVHPEYQNKGIGKLLMQNIENCFESCEKYSLFTAKRIEKNVIFYKKLGYDVVNEEKVNDNLIFVYYNKDNL